MIAVAEQAMFPIPDDFGIYWTVDASVPMIGNAYGYTVHNTTLKSHVGKLGIKFGAQFQDALTILPPETFAKVVDESKGLSGKTNWLFTMFEGLDLPKQFTEYLQKANYLFVPSSWVKASFSRVFPPGKISVVNHGVDPFFIYHKRKFPPKGKKFRFLWVGAPNPRKGWEEASLIWDRTDFGKSPHFELYIKSTRHDKQEVLRNGNVVADYRNLSRRALLDLYHSAHAFLFPTRGEGFGLTLAEAMRTGLPCISPGYSGVVDFFDSSVGYEVGYDIADSKIKLIGRPDLGELDTRVAMPKIDEIAVAMRTIAGNYDAALVKGRKAHERIRDNFTWQKSASRLINTMLFVKYGGKSF